jgi:hypothetical protein
VFPEEVDKFVDEDGPSVAFLVGGDTFEFGGKLVDHHPKVFVDFVHFLLFGLLDGEVLHEEIEVRHNIFEVDLPYLFGGLVVEGWDFCDRVELEEAHVHILVIFLV